MFVFSNFTGLWKTVLAFMNTEQSIHMVVTRLTCAHTYPQLYQQNKKYVIY